jgi:hypothetical protein
MHLLPVLLLLADRLHPLYSGRVMLEMPTILLSLTSLLFLIKSQNEKGLGQLSLAYFFALLCFFTKYGPGIIIFATLVVCNLIQLVSLRNTKDFPKLIRNLAIVWIPSAAVLIVWLFGLKQWNWLLAYSSGQPLRVPVWSIGNFIFYPRLLITEPSTCLAIILIVLGFFTSRRQNRSYSQLLPYLIFVIFVFIMLLKTTQNSVRFGIILFGPIWICATDGLSRFLDFVSQRIRTLVTCIIVAILAVLMVYNHSRHGDRLRLEYENIDGGVNAAYDFIADTVDLLNRKHTMIAMFGRKDQWNDAALLFHLMGKCISTDSDCNPSVLDEKTMYRGILPGWPRVTHPEQVLRRRVQNILNISDFIVTFNKPVENMIGWSIIGSRDFIFKRTDEPPVNMTVVVYSRAQHKSQ